MDGAVGELDRLRLAVWEIGQSCGAARTPDGFNLRVSVVRVDSGLASLRYRAQVTLRSVFILQRLITLALAQQITGSVVLEHQARPVGAGYPRRSAGSVVLVREVNGACVLKPSELFDPPSGAVGKRCPSGTVMKKRRDSILLVEPHLADEANRIGYRRRYSKAVVRNAGDSIRLVLDYRIAFFIPVLIIRAENLKAY